MSVRRTTFASAVILVLLGAGVAARQRVAGLRTSILAPTADLLFASTPARSGRLALDLAAFGASGALRVREALPGQRLYIPLTGPAWAPGDASFRWLPSDGTPGGPGAWESWSADGRVGAPSRPGVYVMQVRAGGDELTLDDLRLLVEVPFERARSGWLGGYYVGQYPADRGRRYTRPAGFIEVTPANEDLPLSRHLRLRQFLTHDQAESWPKYAVVDTRLLDKLELVLAELQRMGVPAHRLYVMSGYRTPQYNRRGLGRGRAVLSRHQYGDAADVWVDDDGDGYMDDLNGDGRRDIRDAAVMLRAVERVERAHPELVGGAGTYAAAAGHGPFIHIDARGRRARWGGAAGA